MSRRRGGVLLMIGIATAAAISPAGGQPAASAALVPGLGTAPLTVEFDATASSGVAPAGVLTYTWDLGDGTVATGPAPRHTYDAPGTYEVRVTLTETVEGFPPSTTLVTVGNVTVVGPPLAPFSDIAGSFAGDAIDALFAKGVLTGTTAGTFDPAAVVTRAEAVVMLVRAVESALLEAAGSTSGGFNFVDITDHPLVTFVRRAADLGLTVGTTPVTFAPSALVDRQQAAVFVVRLYEVLSGITPALAPTPFTDLPGGYADPFIAQAYGLDVTAGIGPSTYAPQGPVSREQMAQLILRTLHALP